MAFVGDRLVRSITRGPPLRRLVKNATCMFTSASAPEWGGDSEPAPGERDALAMAESLSAETYDVVMVKWSVRSGRRTHTPRIRPSCRRRSWLPYDHLHELSQYRQYVWRVERIGVRSRGSGGNYQGTRQFSARSMRSVA